MAYFPAKINCIQLFLILQKQGTWNVKNENDLIMVRTVFVDARLHWVLLLVV